MVIYYNYEDDTTDIFAITPEDEATIRCALAVAAVESYSQKNRDAARKLLEHLTNSRDWTK